MFLRSVTSFLRRLFVKPSPQSFLRAIDDRGLGSVHTLGAKPVVLGRHRGLQQHRFDYLVVASETVGRQHAVIEYRDGAWWVIDQSSLNGTFVNDRKVQTQTLRHGDRIRLHKVEFEFLLSAPARTGSNVDLTIPAAGVGESGDLIDSIRDIDIDQVVDPGQSAGGNPPETGGGLDWELPSDSSEEDVTEQIPQAKRPAPDAPPARPPRSESRSEDEAAADAPPADAPGPVQGSDEETTFLSSPNGDDPDPGDDTRNAPS